MKKVKGIAQWTASFIGRKLVSPVYQGRILGRFPWTLSIYSFLGLCEPGTTTLVKKLLKKGMTFVDLGAWRGYYTLLASKLVGEAGHVFAFEPVPENFALLIRNMKARRNVALIQKAVSNRLGTTELFLSSRDSMSHGIYETCDSIKSIDIEVTTLDEFFLDKDCKIDLIKMDIEGAEMSALEGMTNILRENKNLKIITEFYPRLLQIAGSSPVSFLDKLSEYGFKLYLIDEEGENIEPAAIDDIMKLFEGPKQQFWVNLFCKKD